MHAISDVQKVTSAPIMCAGILTNVLHEEISCKALKVFITTKLWLVKHGGFGLVTEHE
jgi:hypothetical protein